METFSKCYTVAKRASTKSFRIWGTQNLPSSSLVLISATCLLYSPSINLAID